MFSICYPKKYFLISQNCIFRYQEIDFLISNTIWFSNLSIVSVPDESYFRNASYALNLISTFLLLPLGRYLCWWTTGTCFIQKIYAPPPLPYFKVNICPFQSPSPLRLNIFRLFAYSLTKLYRYTPEIFLFSTATFKYTPSEELDKNIQRTSLGLLFSN